jgi:CTP synthase (UTP-ammonia lyase)
VSCQTTAPAENKKGRNCPNERNRHHDGKKISIVPFEVIVRNIAAGITDADSGGLTFSGASADGRLVETMGISDRNFYVGVQYHPEFKSRPNRPHPLFKGFFGAAFRHAKGEEK